MDGAKTNMFSPCMWCLTLKTSTWCAKRRSGHSTKTKQTQLILFTPVLIVIKICKKKFQLWSPLINLGLWPANIFHFAVSFSVGQWWRGSFGGFDSFVWFMGEFEKPLSHYSAERSFLLGWPVWVSWKIIPTSKTKETNNKK